MIGGWMKVIDGVPHQSVRSYRYQVRSQFQNEEPEVEGTYATQEEAQRYIDIVACCYLSRKFHIRCVPVDQWVKVPV